MAAEGRARDKEVLTTAVIKRANRTILLMASPTGNIRMKDVPADALAQQTIEKFMNRDWTNETCTTIRWWGPSLCPAASVDKDDPVCVIESWDGLLAKDGPATPFAGDTTAMIKALVMQEYVQARNTSRTSSVMLAACKFGEVGAASLFGSIYPPCLTATNNVGESPLHMAAKEGHTVVLRMLRGALESTSSIHRAYQHALIAKSKFGLSPVATAVRAGQNEAAYILIRWGGLAEKQHSSSHCTTTTADALFVTTSSSVRSCLKPENLKKLPSQVQYALKNARRYVRHRSKDDLQNRAAFRTLLSASKRVTMPTKCTSGPTLHISMNFQLFEPEPSRPTKNLLPLLAGHSGVILRHIADFLDVLSEEEFAAVQETARALSLAPADVEERRIARKTKSIVPEVDGDEKEAADNSKSTAGVVPLKPLPICDKSFVCSFLGGPVSSKLGISESPRPTNNKNLARRQRQRQGLESEAAGQQVH